MDNILKSLEGKLIVSCQALKDEPLHSSYIMTRMAIAAKEGGASGIRAQGIEDIEEIKKVIDMPIIGIIKKKYEDSEIYITPTKKEVEELIKTKCEIIALDMTERKRPNNENVKDLIELIKKNNRIVMADISTLDEGIEAERLGVDCVSTTLAGYTNYSEFIDGPNYKLIEELSKILKIPVIAEGKIHYPEQLKRVLKNGAFCAVVGGAITRPQEITERFVKEIIKEK
ncbi:MAG: N-acetylmannosamine-6-phosphate 2-epimerase [Clostridium sp.]|uniref:N-acetylmannosamine-6-phosphate 2-epimerase n=1 Tax=Clostridium sp. TaxID=1506 RepID=UPI003EE76C16